MQPSGNVIRLTLKSFAFFALFTTLAALPVALHAQCLSGNCQTGTGVFQFSSGAKYAGDFYASKPHGTGTLFYTNGNRYSGEWVNGMRQGKGKMTFANGNVYEGNFAANHMEGRGTMHYQTKDKYVGSWKKNAPEGQGIYYFLSGERYEGGFVNGRFEGQGIMYYKDGAYFTGQWKDNRRHGQGRMHENSGTIQEGLWVNGTLTDSGAFTATTPTSSSATQGENTTTGSSANQTRPSNSGGTASVGGTYTAASIPSGHQMPDVSNMRNCGKVHCKSSTGYVDYPDGSRYIGEFKDGYPQGKAVCFYANGDRYEGQWAQNAPNGDGIMYFASGRVYGANWLNGTPTGTLEAVETMPEIEKVSMDVTKNVKVWAVVVGVGNYKHMPALRFTDDDAYLYYSFLKSPEGGALRDDQIEILIDDNATRVNILKAMRRQFAKADANDEVILYFSGHGLEGCFLPSDYDGFNNRLRHDEVLAVFAESRAKYKLCVADACHSGTLRGLTAKSPVMVTLDKYYQAFENAHGGTALLMSSQGEEVSLEDQGLRQGIFSHFLLRGLKGEADTDNDTIVSIQEIFTFVHKGVRSYTANAQTPILTGDFDRGMPVSIKRY